MKRVKSGERWPTHCRCGAKLAFSCEDVATGQPAPGADYWCSEGGQEGWHDWGVVTYADHTPTTVEIHSTRTGR